MMSAPPTRDTHGTDDARRWHLAHGQTCRLCWPTPDGLPPISSAPKQEARPVAAAKARPALAPDVIRPDPGRPVSTTLLLRAVRAGQVRRGPDYRYHLGRRDVDDLLYRALDRALLVLYPDGIPQVTPVGDAWIARHAIRGPNPPEVAA